MLYFITSLKAAAISSTTQFRSLFFVCMYEAFKRNKISVEVKWSPGHFIHTSRNRFRLNGVITFRIKMLVKLNQHSRTHPHLYYGYHKSHILEKNNTFQFLWWVHNSSLPLVRTSHLLDIMHSLFPRWR